jgi:hypothetical protein
MQKHAKQNKSQYIKSCQHNLRGQNNKKNKVQWEKCKKN